MGFDQKIECLEEHKKRLLAMKTWKNRFSILRKKTGMTQADFAAKYGMDKTYLSKLVSGARTASEETFEAVEKALESECV